AAYASGYQEDCLVSPLFGDLTDLPPSYIYVGSDEILLDDSVMMAERLKQFGVFCRLNIAEGMWHAYVLYGVPEANDALGEIKAFLEENTDGK
ncbi:MAG: alpha/beta hydrolase, partial [Clostridiales bacterium]